jgi:hypothetical protein
MPGKSTKTPAELFWPKVQKTETCWLWTAATNRQGYGQFHAHRQAILAHRWAYIDARGPIPDGLQLDHLCRIPACVNPVHLEAVTPQVNTLRGVSRAAVNAVKTHCIRGHEFDVVNTYVLPNGKRRCRHCARIADHARRGKPSG